MHGNTVYTALWNTMKQSSTQMSKTVLGFFIITILLKTRFLTVFSFFTRFFYFLVATLLILQNLLNSYMKRLLSDGFNMTAIENSLMKSHSSQTLSCTL